jgi:hypothetical protein
MKATTFEFVIDWWFPFFIFSPSMIVFIAYAIAFWNHPFDWVHVILLFTLATLNFIYGYVRMFLSKVIITEDSLILDYFFIRWKIPRSGIITLQRVLRFAPIGSMSVHQIAWVMDGRVIYINDVQNYPLFKSLFFIDYPGQKKL